MEMAAIAIALNIIGIILNLQKPTKISGWIALGNILLTGVISGALLATT